MSYSSTFPLKYYEYFAPLLTEEKKVSWAEKFKIKNPWNVENNFCYFFLQSHMSSHGKIIISQGGNFVQYLISSKGYCLSQPSSLNNINIEILSGCVTCVNFSYLIVNGHQANSLYNILF